MRIAQGLVFIYMTLKAKITTLSEDDVTITTDRGEVLHMPMSAIEGKIVEGQEVTLLVVASGGEDAGHSTIAKALLNELLKP